ncbi:Multisubstrate pseudouridine synthase 7 [Erysiphe neolycopersici]|uniref:Multisubstrate pseudouridine synthase 7 n=1 Tax=Erysiphe neolycopersici TaxID=212602 RepID=A0A420HXT6_9PEZI|nr:Multisubstrate pseudouridine synthase 7 [Erysiphe neolycopersici]
MTNLHTLADCVEPVSNLQDTSSTIPSKHNKSQTNPRCLHELINDIHKESVGIISVDTQSIRETKVGIHHYVNHTHAGFSGIFKKRYTDFIVNEISLDGKVLHLTNDQDPSECNTPKKEHRVKNSLVNSDLIKSHISESNAITLDSPPTVLSRETNVEDKELHSKTNSQEESISAVAATPEYDVSQEDREVLRILFGEDQEKDILHLYQKILSKPSAKAKEFGTILTPPVFDRQIRSQMHLALRRIFQNRLDSSFDEASKGIRIVAPSKNSRQGTSNRNVDRHNENKLNGKIGWNERGGEYLHMSLYKQDRDTMEVISYMARQLKVKPKVFSYAGTKDRRAVTTQRVSAYRLSMGTVAKINGQIYNATVGDFKYEKSPLQLGELKGNLFTITLRDCHFIHDDPKDVSKRYKKIHDVLDIRCKTLASSGFINYYGLQRFGTFDIGTHIIGKFILQGDYAQAVANILRSSPDAWYMTEEGHEPQNTGKKIGEDELNRARAIRGFGRGELNLEEALAILPKRFSAERSILQHLRNRNSTDYLEALLRVSRNLRLMYVHAYQSYVWNKVVSERWARYSDKVIVGDLVLIESQPKDNATNSQFDECGEVIVRPAAHDIAVTRENIFDRARALTAEEVESGKFSISDIVLPLPGFDVEYPANDIGEYYKIFMASEEGGGLDPANMRRKQRDFSLSGSYRKLIATVSNIGFKAKIYHDENEQLVSTDMDRLLEKRASITSKKIPTDTCGLVAGQSKFDMIQEAEITTQESDEYKSVESPGSKSGLVACSEEKLVNSDRPDLSTLISNPKGHPPRNFSLYQNPSSSSVVDENKKINILGKRNFDSITDSLKIAPKAIIHSSKIPKKTKLPENMCGEFDNSELITTSSNNRPEAQESTLMTSNIIIDDKMTPDPTLNSAKLGIVLWFDLSSSQYATMLLRELMGADNVHHYQPEFGARR